MPMQTSIAWQFKWIYIIWQSSFFSLLHNTIVLTMKVYLYWMSFLLKFSFCILISCIFLEVWKNGKHIVLVWFHLIKFTVSLTNLRHTSILTLPRTFTTSIPSQSPLPPQKKKNYHNNVYEYMYIIFFLSFIYWSSKISVYLFYRLL